MNEKYKDEFTVEYRLPSEMEFLKGMNSEKEVVGNYDNEELKLYDLSITKKISFLSNNVSEMTNIEGKAFGGNYIQQTNEIKEYNSHEKWLGFRCIAELKKN